MAEPSTPSSPPARLWTRANALTTLRLVATPFLADAIARGATGLALALFVLACVTDWIDGPVARRYGEASPLGGLLDHATDAIFVAVGIGAVAATGEWTIVLAPLVVVAFLQYAVDSRASRQRALRASALGRYNGIAYYVLLGIAVVRDGLALSWPSEAVTGVLAWALVVSTIISMLDRLSSHASKS